MIGVFVRLPFAARKRHAVIAGSNDQRVVQLPGLFQRGENAAEMVVVMLHLNGIIEHVPARFGIVRPESRHLIDVAELLAHAQAHAFFVGAMRLVRAKPKTPRLALRRGLQKLLEVARVITIAHRLGRRLGETLVDGCAGDQPALAVGVIGNARPPTLAGDGGGVAVGGKHFHKAAELGRENIHVIRRLLELPRVTASENGRPRRRALGVGRVRAREKNPLPRHAIKRRRLHPLAPIRSGMPEAPVIGNGEEDVGPLRGCGNLSEQENRRQKTKHGTHALLIMHEPLFANRRFDCPQFDATFLP